MSRLDPPPLADVLAALLLFAALAFTVWVALAAFGEPPTTITAQ